MIWSSKPRYEDCIAAFDPPIEISRPDRLTSSAIFASPHSGGQYPDAFLKMSRLSLSQLRRNEDAYVDEMFAPVPQYGAPFLKAHFPRCYVDVNRAADELPTVAGANNPNATLRADMGLGVIPTVISQDEAIYRKAPSDAEIQLRLKRMYHPYHAALQSLINDALTAFGKALVIDCHSMPGFARTGKRRPDIILGDRFGISCHPETIVRIERFFSERGYSVARNHPYAGGYVTSHYGRPHDGVETLQIEINRDLYLNPVTFRKTARHAQLFEDIEEIIIDITAETAGSVPLAAE